MKRLVLCTALLILVAGCAQNTKPPAESSPVPATQASATPVNTHCAVDRGDEIDPKVTYLYQGKIIGFCCEKCVAEFKKDPDKYMKHLK